MTINDEIKLQIAKVPNAPEVIDDWEYISDSLSKKFCWIGSKINWGETAGHKYQELGGEKEYWPSLVIDFIYKYAKDSIFSSREIYYINDSSLDFALKISPDKMEVMLCFLLENVPQHHYFFNLDATWCLVISSEGYVDFGFSN